MSDRWVAPWSPKQINDLVWWQGIGVVHPYTCPNRGDGNHEDHGGWIVDGALVPIEDGWICLDCDYTQDWAHPISDLEIQTVEAIRGRMRLDPNGTDT